MRVAIELSEDDPHSAGHHAIHVKLLGLLDDRDFIRENLAAFEGALQ